MAPAGHLVWAGSGIPDSVIDRRKLTIHAAPPASTRQNAPLPEE
jgi:hypothetical protein